MPQREIPYRAEFLKRLHELYPYAIVIKTNPNKIQGIPDTVILNGVDWVALEFKRSENADRQPNQEYYVELMNSMSYAAFIYPENEEEVMDGIQKAFGPPG